MQRLYCSIVVPVNSHIMCDPTIRQPGFDLSRQQSPLLNRFSHETGTLRCLQKEMVTYRHWSVFCGETQTMSYIVESCPLTKLNGGLSRLHSADEVVVSWLSSYGSWNAYEKIVVPHTQGTPVRITQCYLQITLYLPLPRKHHPFMQIAQIKKERKTKDAVLALLKWGKVAWTLDISRISTLEMPGMFLVQLIKENCITFCFRY